MTLTELLDLADAMDPDDQWELFTASGVRNVRALQRCLSVALQSPYFPPRCLTIFSAAGFRCGIPRLSDTWTRLSAASYMTATRSVGDRRLLEA